MITYTVEQEMIADNDTLIITDPCYIMRDEDWDNWLDSETPLTNYLREKHNFGELIAGDTGYGDWSNTIYNSATGEKIGHFTADAGMVIVCTASDLTNYGYDKDELDRLHSLGCLAIIPNYSGHIQLDYEESESWRVAVISAVSKDEENEFNWNTRHLED